MTLLRSARSAAFRTRLRPLLTLATVGVASLAFAGVAQADPSDATVYQGMSGLNSPELVIPVCSNPGDPYYANEVGNCSDVELESSAVDSSTDEIVYIGIDVPDSVAPNTVFTSQDGTATFQADQAYTDWLNAYEPAVPTGTHWVGYTAKTSSDNWDGANVLDIPFFAVDGSALPASFDYGFVMGGYRTYESEIGVDRQLAKVEKDSEATLSSCLPPEDVDSNGSCDETSQEVCTETGGGETSTDEETRAFRDGDFSCVQGQPLVLHADVNSFSVNSPAAVSVAPGGSVVVPFSVHLVGIAQPDGQSITLTAADSTSGSITAVGGPIVLTPRGDTASPVTVTVAANAVAGPQQVTLTAVTSDGVVEHGMGIVNVVVPAVTPPAPKAPTAPAAPAAPVTAAPTAVLGVSAAPSEPFYLLSRAHPTVCKAYRAPHACVLVAGKHVIATGILTVRPIPLNATLEISVQRVGSHCTANTVQAVARTVCRTPGSVWRRVTLGATQANGDRAWSQRFAALPAGSYVMNVRVSAGPITDLVVGAPLHIVIR